MPWGRCGLRGKMQTIFGGSGMVLSNDVYAQSSKQSFGFRPQLDDTALKLQHFCIIDHHHALTKFELVDLFGIFRISGCISLLLPPLHSPPSSTLSTYLLDSFYPRHCAAGSIGPPWAGRSCHRSSRTEYAITTATEASLDNDKRCVFCFLLADFISAECFRKYRWITHSPRRERLFLDADSLSKSNFSVHRAAEKRIYFICAMCDVHAPTELLNLSTRIKKTLSERNNRIPAKQCIAIEENWINIEHEFVSIKSWKKRKQCQSGVVVAVSSTTMMQ